MASPTKEQESENQENVEEEVKSVKHEIIDVDDDSDYNYYDGSVSMSACPSSSIIVPKPMKCLHESSPPPFLNKIFRMVEDPSTDDIISWSVTKDSFIVWDHHEFSRCILPKYFKHNNFSSFIRQLNTYGFRKINTDRWEFANPEFQGGKKHLLKNIKRRSRTSKKLQRDVMKLGVEAELETIKEGDNMVKTEIMNLREEQEGSLIDIMAAEDRINNVEIKQQQMLYFLTKAATNPEYVQQLFQRRRRSQGGQLVGGEFHKRRRLLAADDSSFIDMSSCRGMNLCEQVQETEPTSELDEELQTLLSQEQSGTADANDSVCHENTVIVKDEESKELASNYSKIFLELENLIEEPMDLRAHVNNTMEHVDGIGAAP